MRLLMAIFTTNPLPRMNTGAVGSSTSSVLCVEIAIGPILRRLTCRQTQVDPFIEPDVQCLEPRHEQQLIDDPAHHFDVVT